MDENTNNNQNSFPHSAAAYGSKPHPSVSTSSASQSLGNNDAANNDAVQPRENNLPQASERYGSLPQPSAPFRNVPQASGGFGNVPQDAVIKSDPDIDYTLTLKEASRRCEEAGLSRTERTMLNWCELDKNGVSQMKCQRDQSTRRWFVNEESFETALAQEISRARSRGEFDGPKVEEEAPQAPATKQSPEGREGSLRWTDSELEFRDVAIASGVKDLRIKDLEGEIEKLEKAIKEERADKRDYIERLITITGRAGQLEGVIGGPALLESKASSQEVPTVINESDLDDESKPVNMPVRDVPHAASRDATTTKF